MRFSHQVGDVEAAQEANLAQRDAENAALIEGAAETVAVILAVGMAGTAIAGCSGGSESEPEGISPVPAVECSIDEAAGEIDNWGSGGVVSPWDGESMTMSYVVQEGDNITKIAACYFLNSEKGADAVAYENRIDNPDLIAPGDEIEITIFKPIKVQLGDEYGSISDLAAHTGFSAEQLYAANGKSFPDDEWKPGKDDVIILPVQNNIDNKPDPTTTTTTTSTPELPKPTVDRVAEIRSFREKWFEYAKSVEDEFGIDRSAVLAQAILESGYGGSELAIDGSNLFGVKAHEGAETNPYWDGTVIQHETTEFLTDEELARPYWQERLVETVAVTDEGLNEVRVNADFRQYADFMDSFLDYGYKITNEEIYSDAAAQIGEDPIEYIKEVAKAGYANDPKYIEKVIGLYNVLSELESAGEPEPTPEPPSPGAGDVINPSELDYSDFPTEERDSVLRGSINEAAANLTLEQFIAFRESGIIDKTELTKSIVTLDGAYNTLFGRERDSALKYIVWHAWANGIPEVQYDVNGGTETSSSEGNSHSVPLETQIRGWQSGYANWLESKKTDPDAGASYGSAHVLVGDNGEVWKVTGYDKKTIHAGSGAVDDAKEHGFGKYVVDNENSVGIEVQLDTIYDDDEAEDYEGEVPKWVQFQNLIMTTVHIAVAEGIVNDSMTEGEIRAAINEAVVGHGKNPSKFNPGSGVEFGWKYREPLLQMAQELAVAYLKR